MSSFRKRIAIHVRDIEFIDEIRWMTIHPIRLYLARRSELGDRIVFMPRGRILPFVSHPLVAELTRLAEEARAGSARTPGDDDRDASGG